MTGARVQEPSAIQPASPQAVDPKAYLPQFLKDLERRVNAARQPGMSMGEWSHALVKAASLSLTEPLGPDVPLTRLPLPVAQAILASRAAAMQDFLKSWSESIIKNAKADQQAYLRDLLKRVGENATERASRWLKYVTEKANATGASSSGSANHPAQLHGQPRASVNRSVPATSHGEARLAGPVPVPREALRPSLPVLAHHKSGVQPAPQRPGAPSPEEPSARYGLNLRRRSGLA